MTLTVADCKAKLARAQQWIHPNTVGGYIGVELEAKSPSDYAHALGVLKTAGCDYALVKVYEHNSPTHGDEFWIPLTTLAGIATTTKIGIAPYLYCHPESVATDIIMGIACAKGFGGVVLDCETEWVGHATSLHALINGIRLAVPDAVIIVSGYADPVTAFSDNKGGTAWPFDAMQDADAYQPQFYIGSWDRYLNNGHDWLGAITWADQQLSVAFNQHGLTSSFPIAPAMSVQGLLGDQQHLLAQYLHQTFALSLAVWEYALLTPEIVSQMRFTPAPIPRPSRVHVVHPNFMSLSEFSGGFTDDCGPCAETVVIGTVRGFAPTSTYMTEIRRRDIASIPALFHPTTGNTIDDVYTDMTQKDPYHVPVHLLRVTDDAMEHTLITALQSGKVCLVNLANASQLPHNEPGVRYHFIAIGGYDEVLGFYIANGDYWTGSGVVASGPTPLYWVSWLELHAAQPFAVLVCG